MTGDVVTTGRFAFGYRRRDHGPLSPGRMRLDAVTPKDKKAADQHSHVVRPANMERQKTRFAGCEVEPLLFGPRDRPRHRADALPAGRGVTGSWARQGRADLRARRQAGGQEGPAEFLSLTANLLGASALRGIQQPVL